MDASALKPAPVKALLNLARGTGNPVGFEDFVPLNPWGRAFPKDLLNRKPRPPLYQVIVRDKRDGNKELRVGPKWGKEFAEMFCMEINKLISSGMEKQWSDPVVIPVPRELA